MTPRVRLFDELGKAQFDPSYAKEFCFIRDEVAKGDKTNE